LIVSDEALCAKRGCIGDTTVRLSKPVNAEQLLAHVHALLRENQALDVIHAESTTPSSTTLQLDPPHYQVVVAGRRIPLSATEYRLLTFLMEHAGQIFTPRQLLERVWGWEAATHKNYLHTYIWRLRHKIEADPKRPQYLLNEYGLGYCFAKQASR